MTSSTLGAIGASTQSHYAAANAFLDSMARHRWGLGFQACAISLGMIVEIGHVEDHPEVAEAFRQNGVYGIPEGEYLMMMEAACRRRDTSRASSWPEDPCAAAHLVTGMEPGKVAKAGVKSSWLQDNRFRHLVMAVEAMSETKTFSRGSGALDTAAALLAAADASGEAGVRSTVQDLVLREFCKQVLVPMEKLSASLKRPLSGFGMDSMITAELRKWAWKELGAAIPFMALLEGGMQVGELVELIWRNMNHSVWKRSFG